MAVVIDNNVTGDERTALGGFNQRTIARTSLGVLWLYHYPSAFDEPILYYSDDNGATWQQSPTQLVIDGGGPSSSIWGGGSIFIDQDDYLHVAYNDRTYSNERIYYQRGTFNGSHTDVTFSADYLVDNASDSNLFPDVVAHREGTGWAAHIVYGHHNSPFSYTYYKKVVITSGGTITVDGASTQLGLFDATSGYDAWPMPTIDFHHTGDGKTIQSSAPHLFVAWESQNSIVFRKGAYSGGTWTWGSERTINTGLGPNLYTLGEGYTSEHYLNCLFDGTRVIIGGWLVRSSDGERCLVLFDRDVADTATTTQLEQVTATTADYFENGQMTYDAEGNVYFFGRHADANEDSVYRKWTRATDTLEAEVVIDSVPEDGNPIRVARGGYTAAMDYVWYNDLDDDLSYDQVTFNSPPNAPTGLTPSGGTTINRAITNRLDWAFSDDDAGDTQSKFDLRYRIVGAGSWTDVLDQSTTNSHYDVTGGTFLADDYEWQVRTYDSQGEVGPYSSSALFTAANSPSGPSISDPINNQIIATQSYVVEWTASDQDSYQVRTVADSSGSPDTATVYTDTGEVVSAGARSRSVTFDTNNRFEHIQVRVKHDSLWSTWASVRVEVSFTPPPTPTVVLTAGSSTLDVEITNPTPSGSEPSVTHNDVYVDDGDGEERKAREVAPNSTWTYRTPVSGRNYTAFVRVVAHADNGTTAES